jgi:hypothetical protein
VNRYVVLYLATLIVLVPIDFLFLGLVAKGFFTSQVGDMLGEIRLGPAILFYLLYVVGILVFVSGQADLAIDAAVWRVVRIFLLRDLRTDIAIAAQALDLAGGHGRCELGHVRDGGVVRDRAVDRQCDQADPVRAQRRSHRLLRRPLRPLVTSAAARSGDTASAISSLRDRWSWLLRR